MGKTLKTALTLLLTPSLSLASMDMPVGVAVLPPMLYLGLVFIGLEMFAFSRTLKIKKFDAIKVTSSTYVLTFIFMIAFSWSGIGLHHLLKNLLGRPLGVYVGIDDPSLWDKIYTATIGCFYLPGPEHVVVAGFALLSFLIPVFIISGLIARKLLIKKKQADVNEVRRIVRNLKGVELVVIWCGSLFFFFKWYYG